jgi:hypothetical protein
MADKKISQLTAASLPLAGTEVLPIVQSNATVKVSSDDLTVKNVRSNATTGILQVTGPAAGQTRVMTTPDANFTAARTDAANSFTGDQTLATGNLVIGTSGKGIDFSADGQAAGMTSELLDDYEEGTFNAQVTDSSTPANNATMSAITCRYTKIGRQVFVHGNVSTSSVAGLSGTIRIAGLPFAAVAQSAGSIGFSSGLNIPAGYSATLVVNPGSSFMSVQVWDVATGTTAMTVAEWSDDGNIALAFTYTV